MSTAIAQGRPPTADEVIALVRQHIVQREGNDRLRIKVTRTNRTDQPIGEFVAILDDAKLEHVVNPEPWLLDLAGGGPIFKLQIYHAEDTASMIGITRIDINAPPKDVDPRIVNDRSWVGPGKVTFPKEPRPVIQPGGTISTLSFAERNGGASQTPPNAVGGGGSPQEQHLSGMLASMEHRMRASEERDARRDASIAEERRRNELADVRRESDARATRLEAQIASLAAQIATRPVEPKGLDVAGIVAAAAPIFSMMIQQNAETARKMAEVQQQIAAAQALATRDSAATTEKLLTVLMNKPTDDTAIRLMEPLTAASAAVMNMSMNLMTNLVDNGLAGGQGPDPVVTALTEGARVATAYLESKDREDRPRTVLRREQPRTQPPIGAIPTQPQSPTQTQLVQPPLVQPIAQAPSRRAPPQQQRNTPAPAPTPALAPTPAPHVVDEIVAAIMASPDDIVAAMATIDAKETKAIPAAEDIEAARARILGGGSARDAAAKGIAKMFLRGLSSPEIRARSEVVSAAGGGLDDLVNDLFRAKISGFAMKSEENREYLKSIFGWAHRLGVESGIFQVEEQVPAPAVAAGATAAGGAAPTAAAEAVPPTEEAIIEAPVPTTIAEAFAEEMGDAEEMAQHMAVRT